jgi:hypothetical protein
MSLEFGNTKIKLNLGVDGATNHKAGADDGGLWRIITMICSPVSLVKMQLYLKRVLSSPSTVVR